MSKSKEELNELKKEVESVNEKLAELTPEEIAQVNGGVGPHDLDIVRVVEPLAHHIVFNPMIHDSE